MTPEAAHTIADMWDTTASVYLDQDLWTEREAYDACHYLMVPLHAAYEGGRAEWRNQFDSQFERYARDFDSSLSVGLLTRMHYQYLASRYLVLKSARGETDGITRSIHERLVAETVATWSERNAWQWAREDFPTMRDRVIWKLGPQATDNSYEKALIDEELLIFAIAADLVAVERAGGTPASDDLLDILDVAFRAFTHRSSIIENGGWLLQPGIWWDHPDFKYAGNASIEALLEPKPLRGIAFDTSHSHRLPLVLTSLEGAESPASERAIAYRAMLDGLAMQFRSEVLVAPGETFDGWRTTNYLDGHNGVYRYGYATQGESNGYGPYELSGTFLLGWWSLLDDVEVRAAYLDQASRFPPEAREMATYVGPNTSRARNPLTRFPDALENGFLELICRLAAGER
jgi:hypothetical protein